MKYIDSEVVISAMVLGMYENGMSSISEDEAEQFDLKYTYGLSQKYFSKEPLISNHVSRNTLIKFAEKYSDFVEFSRFTSTLTIKWKPEDEELAFKTMLLDVLNDWLKTVRS